MSTSSAILSDFETSAGNETAESNEGQRGQHVKERLKLGISWGVLGLTFTHVRTLWALEAHWLNTRPAAVSACDPPTAPPSKSSPWTALEHFFDGTHRLSALLVQFTTFNLFLSLRLSLRHDLYSPHHRQSFYECILSISYLIVSFFCTVSRHSKPTSYLRHTTSREANCYNTIQDTSIKVHLL